MIKKKLKSWSKFISADELAQGLEGTVAPEPALLFYECMIALNVETIDDEFEDKEIRRSGKSFSRDYEMLTMEICFLGKSLLKFFCSLGNNLCPSVLLYDTFGGTL